MVAAGDASSMGPSAAVNKASYCPKSTGITCTWSATAANVSCPKSARTARTVTDTRAFTN